MFHILQTLFLALLDLCCLRRINDIFVLYDVCDILTNLNMNGDQSVYVILVYHKSVWFCDASVAESEVS